MSTLIVKLDTPKEEEPTWVSAEDYKEFMNSVEKFSTKYNISVTGGSFFIRGESQNTNQESTP